MGGWKRRERKEQEERGDDGWEGGSRTEGREEGREAEWKRGGWKEEEEGRGQEGRGRKKGGRKDGLQRVEPLITVGGVVVIRLSVRRWLRSFVHHCALIAVDGVVVVWALVALVVWARVSVNGMVVGALLWAFVAVCGYWDLAMVVVDRVCVVFRVTVDQRRRGPCLLCEKR